MCDIKEGVWRNIKVGNEYRDCKVECWKSADCKDCKHRYKLRISLIGTTSTKEILVIMLNPSTADEKTDNWDKTCEFLINICHSNGYDLITICNLFSFITKEVEELDKKIQEENSNSIDEALRESIKKANEILCAWGGPYKKIKNKQKQILNDMIKEVFGILKSRNLNVKKVLKLRIKKKSENKFPKYPPHPLCKKYNTEFEPYFIAEINIEE